MRYKKKGRLKMRRSRRQRENENPMIEAIKWWQNRTANVILFIGLPLALLYVGLSWWVGTPMGREFTGWTDFESRSEQRLENLNDDMEKKYNEFTESTNEDVQNTIDNIERTQDTQVTEQYSEEVQNTINDLDGTQ